MIQENEIRIGNLVMTNFKRENEIVDIQLIDFKEEYFCLYDPIPITEEITIKFGYECLTEMACDFTEKSRYRIEITSKDLKELYAHQLQNLYFTLTGQELTFKN